MSRMGWRAIFTVMAISLTLAWFDACRSLRFAAQAAHPREIANSRQAAVAPRSLPRASDANLAHTVRTSAREGARTR